jgi:hypothetical protein
MAAVMARRLTLFSESQLKNWLLLSRKKTLKYLIL